MTNKLARIKKGLGAFAISLMVVSPGLISNALGASTDQVSTSFQLLTKSNLLVLGPVDRVDVSKSAVQVLGQVVVIPASQRNLLIDDLVGRMVAVYGSLKGDGSLKVEEVSQLATSNYVPGATQLYLKGTRDFR